MYTHTHVHVTTSLAHYTHTHLGAVSHSVDDTLQQKDQGTSPSKKGTEREGWEPIEVEGELRQEERRRESLGKVHLTNTHTPYVCKHVTHTQREENIVHFDKTLYTLYGLCRISVTVIHDICTQKSALCRPSR